ncbi:glycosyltransferase (plasmid) [Halobaculum sp. CBA1158]|uniref:glycosyltransferase n=1 Tax=Halobaculum sp. CBA1158 TaxID=2904243 RepID=UPI001F39A7A5|nr:glycosyltransferase [Halobaculum sp. CBA1158]UIP01532.1 glycosyltransferase [Halobaculum sp. CBA1158]
MRVLNLVPTEQSRFFTQQRATLRELGVEETTLAVPGRRTYDDGDTDGRGFSDYLRFVPSVFRHSLGEYDLVHANYGLTAPHALAQVRLPVVLSLWGSDLMGDYGWLTRRCARHADAVVVMSERMAAELDTDCHVIPHGVDLELFRPMPVDAAREALGWRDDPDAHHVLFPYPPARGVKDYPRAERVVDRVADAVDGDVRFHTVTGEPHERMPLYMNAADVLLVTSEREGSPNAVKEALACDLPVVSTDVGDVPERLDGVAHSRVCGSDADLVDGIVAALRADGRSNGRAAAEEVGLEATTARLRAVYESVVGVAREPALAGR